MKIQSWEVIAVDSQNEINPCQGCVFSFEGRAQRNCPALIDTEGNKSKLCTAFGKTFHFKEVNNVQGKPGKREGNISSRRRPRR